MGQQHRNQRCLEPTGAGVAPEVRRVPADDLERVRCEELADAANALRREIASSARALVTLATRIAQSEERAGRLEAAHAIRLIARPGIRDCADEAASFASGERRRGGGNPDAGAAARLGQRERHVLELLADGKRSTHIARRLGITPATVEVHRRNIMRELDLHTVAGLTKFAIREGLTAL